MPKQKGRGRRVKSVVRAFGGGKSAQKATAKGVKAGRKIYKGTVGKKPGATKEGLRAAGGALKNLGKTKLGRQQRKKFFG